MEESLSEYMLRRFCSAYPTVPISLSKVKAYLDTVDDWRELDDSHLALLYNFLVFGERSVKESEEFLSNDENLVDALKYEFGNHECGLTFEFENGIIALGYTVKEFLSDDRKKKLFVKARKEYINSLEG